MILVGRLERGNKQNFILGPRGGELAHMQKMSNLAWSLAIHTSGLVCMSSDNGEANWQTVGFLQYLSVKEKPHILSFL
jgi:hypothetical protein